MSFLALGAAVVLAGYAVATTLGSLAAVGVWSALPRTGFDPAARARLLFRLRLAPAAGGLAILGVQVPAFLVHEPRAGVEPVGLPLLALAVAGAGLLGAGVWRAVRDERDTRRLAGAWRVGGTRLPLPGFASRGYVFDWPFPVVSVVGRRRPSLFVERRVLEACSPAELEAILGHERAHVVRRDNLKRALMRACPDALALTPLARRIEADWSEAAGSAADAAASGGSEARRLALASAILKLARLATPPPAAVPGSAAYGGAPIGFRVGRLLSGEEAPPRGAPLAAAALGAGSLALYALALSHLDRVHELTELAVAYLS